MDFPLVTSTLALVFSVLGFYQHHPGAVSTRAIFVYRKVHVHSILKEKKITALTGWQTNELHFLSTELKYEIILSHFTGGLFLI